jgi:hypothetical protein
MVAVGGAGNFVRTSSLEAISRMEGNEGLVVGGNSSHSTKLYWQERYLPRATPREKKRGPVIGIEGGEEEGQWRRSRRRRKRAARIILQIAS